MSIKEIIERLDKMAQHHEICGKTFAPDFSREKYQAWGQTLREAISLLRTHQDAQPNEPLTLEELREIDGVVWVCYPQATFGTRLPPTDQLTCTRYKFSFSDYGKTWLAYRRPPKEA